MRVDCVRGLRYGWAALAVAMVAGAPRTAGAQINCNNLPHWSATAPPVNQTHVYCGEWNAGQQQPKGFHSQPAGLTPAGIAILQTNPVNAQGVYSIQWEFTAHQGHPKFSTMFPNACSQAEVLTSIVYAANNPQACPPNAPPWAQCGPSRPGVGGAQYCNGANGAALTIAFATLANGNVNTAFPLQ